MHSKRGEERFVIFISPPFFWGVTVGGWTPQALDFRGVHHVRCSSAAHRCRRALGRLCSSGTRLQGSPAVSKKLNFHCSCSEMRLRQHGPLLLKSNQSSLLVSPPCRSQTLMGSLQNSKGFAAVQKQVDAFSGKSGAPSAPVSKTAELR